MTAVILRRKKLGKGSSEGIANVSTTGIKVVRNWELDDWPNPAPDLVIRWGCTSNTPNGARQKVLNTAKAIHWCSDKRQGRLDMQVAGVPVPKTYFNEREFLDCCPGMYVVRKAQHAQGRDLFCGPPAAALAQFLNWGGTGYISELINKVAEYRVMVVQNRVAWVAKKTPGNPDDVAWNVAQGGRFDNVRWGEWPLAVVKAALAAAKVSGCDFCGVDVMVDAEGNPYVLEINSAPSQTSPYRQQCLAKCFDYIVTNGKQHFYDNVITSWKHAIHPAVWSSSRG
jgi:glutathione synthase/RimK-type ligase-like ATP-grasp enzyme